MNGNVSDTNLWDPDPVTTFTVPPLLWGAILSCSTSAAQFAFLAFFEILLPCRIFVLLGGEGAVKAQCQRLLRIGS